MQTIGWVRILGYVLSLQIASALLLLIPMFSSLFDMEPSLKIFIISLGAYACLLLYLFIKRKSLFRPLFALYILIAGAAGVWELFNPTLIMTPEQLALSDLIGMDLSLPDKIISIVPGVLCLALLDVYILRSKKMKEIFAL